MRNGTCSLEVAHLHHGSGVSTGLLGRQTNERLTGSLESCSLSLRRVDGPSWTLSLRLMLVVWSPRQPGYHLQFDFLLGEMHTDKRISKSKVILSGSYRCEHSYTLPEGMMGSHPHAWSALDSSPIRPRLTHFSLPPPPLAPLSPCEQKMDHS